jgi:RNA polymerase sigma-70 factor (ECF subfamily)
VTDDRRLIAETLAGRTAAYGELVRKYEGRVFNLTARILGNAEDAADAAQEAFIHAYQALPAFKGDCEFFTWLYRIAFNAAVSQKRRRRPVGRLEVNGDGSVEPPDPASDRPPSAGLERAEDVAAVTNALNRLSPDHRAVLVLKDIEGLAYEQIADVVGVPIGTVRSRIHRARLELRTLLASAGGRPDLSPGGHGH